ncbi:nitroreductase family deazaflavin-dependent oxidoreductase [Streptosporangium sp. 'caverna']|uniref:nitroreductase family deazaflavin-dependent oxidoreductase n=1 Tax=Streptosporangium sp. 'caverna' TaxID=2202249 RepID=UPI000D7D2EE3|nr:nitroreductase family deazaflavin-dependent oxidoreductase [Streptosporangium sp. 'caverna']AWS46075.1 nitroreductase family deazaflavin-dependent oxidoreductase [Streptosporangium sp. 'caverna']
MDGRAGEDVHDSPNDWVARHIRSFLATGGQARPGMNDLLLTTRGRKSGTLRRTALVYGRDGDRFVLAASNGGAPNHPAWYLNLLDDSEVTMQVGTETFTGRARTATAEEKPRLWLLMISIMPSYADYQRQTGRDIPVVIVERV